VKTLHITNAWHSNSGGIATFYRALMEAARHRAHEIRLVVPGDEDRVEEVNSHARIYTVASRKAPLNPEYRMMLPNAYIQKGARLRQILNDERPDVVEVCDKYTLNYFGGILRTGMMGDVTVKPLLVGLSCERMDDNVRAYFGWNWLYQSLVAFYMKWLYFAFFDHHIVNSEYTGEELKGVSTGHDIRRGVWIRPMGVDTHDLSPNHRSSVSRRNLLERVHAEPGTKLLLYVGRLAREKNLGLLVEMMEILHKDAGQNWKLVMAGDGTQRVELLEEAARRAPGRVSWLGHVRNRPELARIYANCDLFVHPNPREPFGIAPLEAMASGLPVIVPNRGGVLSYANPANAWIAAPEPASFAAAVRDAVANSPAREEKIAKALRTAADFNWDHAAGAFLDLHEDLWRTSQGEQPRIGADFYSTAPHKSGAVVARLAAGIARRSYYAFASAGEKLKEQR
jgi:alpha-1,6-mannosyltransferase